MQLRQGLRGISPNVLSQRLVERFVGLFHSS
jgi:hypothetical protein